MLNRITAGVALCALAVALGGCVIEPPADPYPPPTPPPAPAHAPPQQPGAPATT